MFCKTFLPKPGAGKRPLNGSNSVSYWGLGSLYPCSEEGKRERKGEERKEKGSKAAKEGRKNLGLELEEREEPSDDGKAKNVAM